MQSLPVPTPEQRGRTPPLYLTIVVHNEEGEPGYLDRQFYVRNREFLRRLGLVVKQRSATLNLQSDWVFLKAVAAYDTGDVVAATGGKNIVRWMVEDLGFEADPHAHETRHNYADVAYLHSQLGVKPTGTVGGFLYDPPDNPQGWEQHEAGVRGRVYPDSFWRADLLWGAGTFLHRGKDERRYGMWRPKDRYHFYEHDPARRLMYIGGNCYAWAGPPPVEVAGINKAVDAIASGRAPRDGFYTANIFLPQALLSDALLEKVAADLDLLTPLARAGKIVWSPLRRTAARWLTEYGGKPFQYPCIGPEAPKP